MRMRTMVCDSIIIIGTVLQGMQESLQREHQEAIISLRLLWSHESNETISFKINPRTEIYSNSWTMHCYSSSSILKKMTKYEKKVFE